MHAYLPEAWLEQYLLNREAVEVYVTKSDLEAFLI